MAQFIDMKQVPSGTVTAVDDRIMYDVNLESGIIHGCEISYQGHNMIHINAGYGVIKGGLFEMKDHTEYVDLANSTDTTGQIYLHFDAAAADKLTIISETSSTLHQMVQEEDANFNNGVYEIQLCTYIATQTVLTNVEQTFPAAKGAVDVLDTLQAIMANNEEGKIAGALAVKALNTNFTQSLQDIDLKYDTASGKPMWKERGAGSFNFFSSWEYFISALSSFAFACSKDFVASAKLSRYSPLTINGIYIYWTDATGWNLIPSKRIKGKYFNYTDNGVSLAPYDFDYPANVTQNIQYKYLVVTDIID